MLWQCSSVLCICGAVYTIISNILTTLAMSLSIDFDSGGISDGRAGLSSRGPRPNLGGLSLLPIFSSRFPTLFSEVFHQL